MDAAIDLRTRIDRHPQVVFRELGGSEGGVLLHLVTGQYFGLNATGALVWNLLDGRRTLEEIVAEVGAQVDDAPARLTEDIMEFIRHLHERELIATVAIRPAANGTQPVSLE